MRSVRIHMSAPASIVPIAPPYLATSGSTLRTVFSSFAIQLSRTRRLVARQHVTAAVRGNRGEGGLGGEHARFHRRVAALDPRHVDEARRAADQRAAREGELRHRLPAALVDRPRAIGDALAALEELADRRMLLPALEFLERREVRVAVVERDDEARAPPARSPDDRGSRRPRRRRAASPGCGSPGPAHASRDQCPIAP